MGSIWGGIGNFIGDVTGYNAQQRADSAAKTASKGLGQASGLNLAQGANIDTERQGNQAQEGFYNKGAQESLGANAAETAQKAQAAASPLALQAANQAGGQAAAGARAAGLNAGQAAQLAAQGVNGYLSEQSPE